MKMKVWASQERIMATALKNWDNCQVLRELLHHLLSSLFLMGKYRAVSSPG